MGLHPIDGKDRHPFSRDPADQRAVASRELEMFQQAALQGASMRLPDEPVSRFKTHLFFLGAALRLAQTYGLNDEDFIGMAMDYLTGVGLDMEASAAIMSSFPSLIQDPELTEAVGEGIETLSLWHRSRDVNAPLRLAQLIHEWETA